MSDAMNPLNIHSFPLQGQSLIEASAGTGKTYTINQLYRRLVLGHGDVPRSMKQNPESISATDSVSEFATGLGCTDILVVTFTKAATEELRGRIREGLRGAFESLLQESPDDIQDADIKVWLSELEKDGVDLKRLRTWLQVNLSQMDEASIYTIHKFCAQMLKRYAFDSGVGFNLSLETEGEEYLTRACEDVWRRFCYPQSRDVLAFATAQLKGPGALYNRYRSWMSKPDLAIVPSLEKDFDQLWKELRATFNDAKTLWALLGSEGVTEQIFKVDIDKRSYSSRHYPNWLSEAGAYFSGQSPLPVPKNLNRFGALMLSEKTKKGEAPAHPLFSKTDELLDIVQQLGQALDVMWFRAVYSRYLELLEQASVITSDDLLRLLDQALSSERGESLAAQIRQLYPVAMIDEFQDTDPTQYRIFNRIYPPADTAQPGYSLIMIGDPKQAIYAFRGADIFTYMQARQKIPSGRRFTLDTNYRSDSRLISATNALWQGKNSPFVFDEHIDFYPVKAGGHHDKKVPEWQKGIPDHALQLWYSDLAESKGEGILRVAEECATQIQDLLAGAAVYPDGSRRTRPVSAGDIAVLVYSRTQAAYIRNALSEKNIGSIFLTRDNVLESAEAHDLYAIIEAVANPSNEAFARRALATPAWGKTAADLVGMQEDEFLWEQQLNEFRHYHQIWQRRGIMAMLMQWLEDDERAVRLRKRPDGERVLTNILHLSEMLQAQSRKVRGHQTLLRWLGDRMDPDQHKGEEAQLRLETDDRLVNIVTIHKSKGLEYPFVFLPYLWADSVKPNVRNTETLYYNGNEVVRDLNPDDKAKEKAQRDRLAEQMRLLYVALTRAKFCNFVWVSGAADARKKELVPYWHESALGYLLNNADLSSTQIDGVYIGECPSWQSHAQAELDVPLPPVAQAMNKARLRDSWRVGSYSQLASHSAHNAEQAAADLGHYFDWEAALSLASVTDKTELPVALSFPKGANPGTCLHAIYEHWDFEDTDALHRVCEQQLALYGLDEQPAEAVADWIAATVRQPLALYDTNVSLSEIKAASRLDEMEFYLPVGNLTAGDIDALLGGDGRFHFEPMTGYIKGFIDLIFEWQGRYYVADYKSNHLGYEWRDYLPGALRDSMKDHRYDLQSWIYMLALDQLLSQRLPDYQPQRHLGGSVYFYLRGMGDHFTDADPDAGVCFSPVNVEALRHWRQVILAGAASAGPEGTGPENKGSRS